MRNKIVFLIAFCCLPSLITAQCVVINEIMIDAAHPCDGSCVPNTAEWIELYNTCDTPVDLSCYVIADDDWTYVFPQGTTIAASGWLTIGGAAGEEDPPDLNWEDGNGSWIGVFTNSGEQVALFDNDGDFIDGVIWKGGQNLPTTISTGSVVTGCSMVQLDLPAANSSLWNVLSEGTEDCTFARAEDGSNIWEVRCRSNFAITYGTSNHVINYFANFTHTKFCLEDTIEFQSSVENVGDSLVWNFDDPASGASNTSYLDDPIHKYSSTGTYNVTLTAYKDGVGYPTTYPVNIFEATVDLGEDLESCEGASVELSAENTGGLYLWQDGSSSQTLSVTESGLYYVQVVNNSCRAEDSIIVTLIPCSIEIPNIFTPNDDDFNDIFEPISSSGIIELNTVIYNRWGRQVYDSDLINIGWNGGDLAEDVFFWQIDYVDLAHRATRLKGTVNLIR